MSVTAYHFWSPTCAPCKVIKPAVEDLKEEFSQVNWLSVNVENDPNNYAREFSVKVWPTIVVLVRNAAGDITYVGKESGPAMANYYRLIRTALRST
jgi:thiol-disulfide isomerase/thioredoxin